MARIYVGGPKGSGKTTACKLIAQRLGISSITGSEIMRRAAGLPNREEIDQLPEDVKNDLRLHAFETYYRATPNLIIDGHFYLTETDIKYFDAFVLVEADVEKLVEFRKRDGSRPRRPDCSEIEEEISQLEDRLVKLESNFGIKVVRVKNDSTLEELIKSIENVYVSASLEETRRELQNRGNERI